MSLYKVEFKDNNAIAGKKIPAWLHQDVKEFSINGTRQQIKWYIVDAENEIQAIEIADKIVRRIWGRILGLV